MLKLGPWAAGTGMRALESGGRAVRGYLRECQQQTPYSSQTLQVQWETLYLWALKPSLWFPTVQVGLRVIMALLWIHSGSLLISLLW